MKRHNYISFFLALLLSSFTSFSDMQDSVFEKKYKIDLKDGDKLKLGELIYNEPKLISDESQLNSGVIKSFDTDVIDSKDLISYINMISLERTFGYFSVTPGRFGGTRNHYIPSTTRIYSLYDKHGGSYGYHEYAEEFRSYYHNLFRTQITRKLLFNFALNFVVDRCNEWPKDFKDRVLENLDELSESIPKISKLSIQEFENKIIGNKDYNYVHGFIFRRIKTDRVPLSEVMQYINIARQTIGNLDIESNPDYKFGILLNNHLIVHVGADNQFKIKSNLNSQFVNINDSFGERAYISEITYLNGDDGDFYLIKIQTGYRESQLHLYDSRLNLIY